MPLGPFTYGGSLRAFNFVRQDVPQAGNPNGTAVAQGRTLDVRYAIPHTALQLGTSYTGTQPGDINGPQPQGNSRLVNSLPAFSLSTIDEAFVGYDTLGIAATIGDRFYDFTWLPAADSHIKPAAYQGGDVSFQPIRGLQLGATRVIRYESRTSSNFQPDTLLTAVVPVSRRRPLSVGPRARFGSSRAARSDLSAPESSAMRSTTPRRSGTRMRAGRSRRARCRDRTSRCRGFANASGRANASIMPCVSGVRGTCNVTKSAPRSTVSSVVSVAESVRACITAT